MFKKIKSLLGMKSVDYSILVKNGAQIMDVRTRAEYSGGHLKGSMNIPLQELDKNIKKLKKDKPVILCCASGMRSASAKGIFIRNGFKEVYNAGSWGSLSRKLD